MARSLSSFDSHLSTVPARGALCPCGSTELDGARLDHDGRAECCEDYCSPDACSCESGFVTTFQETHGHTAELAVRALVECGEGRQAAERDVARSTTEGEEHVAWLLGDVRTNPKYYLTGERAESKTVVTTQRIYPITDETMAMLDAVEPVAITCGCGRSHTRAAFLALPAVGTMDDGIGGTLLLRNCQCGSTRAILATAEELLRACPEFSAHVDGWKAEAIAHQELFGIFEELAGAATAENDGDWEAEARSGYLADLGIAAGGLR